jgi:DNA mismatch repair protein MLH1
VRTTPCDSQTDSVKILFGVAVARELLPLSASNEGLGAELKGFVTNANFSQKKTTFILFINGKHA